MRFPPRFGKKIGLFNEFATKVATNVENGHYFRNLVKIWGKKFFFEILGSSACTRLQALDGKNFVGVSKYYVGVSLPINGLKIGPNPISILGLKNFIIKFWTFWPSKNQNFNFWGHNMLFWDFLRDSGRKLVVLSNFQQKLQQLLKSAIIFEIWWEFENFWFFAKFWVQALVPPTSAWCPKFGGGPKVLCFSFIVHKWFENWRNSGKDKGNEI